MNFYDIKIGPYYVWICLVSLGGVSIQEINIGSFWVDFAYGNMATSIKSRSHERAMMFNEIIRLS